MAVELLRDNDKDREIYMLALRLLDEQSTSSNKHAFYQLHHHRGEYVGVNHISDTYTITSMGRSSRPVHAIQPTHHRHTNS
jgi:hypothetical protein